VRVSPIFWLCRKFLPSFPLTELIIAGGFQLSGYNSLVVPRTLHKSAKNVAYPFKALGYVKLTADGKINGTYRGMLIPPLTSLNAISAFDV